MTTVRAPSDDPLLAQRAAAGDRAAFEALVRRHSGQVYGLCRRLVGDAAEAEDRAQEAFLKAFRHLDRYDPARPFLPWLLRIARNACLDALRARRAWGPLPEQLPADEAAPPVDWGVRQQVGEAVEALAPQQRAVLHLRFALGLSGPEIAAELGASPGAVRACLHRALHTLRRRLRP